MFYIKFTYSIHSLMFSFFCFLYIRISEAVYFERKEAQRRLYQSTVLNWLKFKSKPKRRTIYLKYRIVLSFKRINQSSKVKNFPVIETY